MVVFCYYLSCVITAVMSWISVIHTLLHKHEVNRFLRFNGHWTSALTIASGSGVNRIKDKGKQQAWGSAGEDSSDMYLALLAGRNSCIAVKANIYITVNDYQILALLNYSDALLCSRYFENALENWDITIKPMGVQ